MAPFLLPSFFNINKQKLVTETYELPSSRAEPNKKEKGQKIYQSSSLSNSYFELLISAYCAGASTSLVCSDGLSPASSRFFLSRLRRI